MTITKPFDDQLMKAYNAAIGDRDPDDVDIFELIATILDAVPGSTPEQLMEVLESSSRQDEQHERELRAGTSA